MCASRKSTTCNDLNVCFDVKDSLPSMPINCSDPHIKNDFDIHVICYLKFFNMPVALSLAFSFTGFILIVIQISLKFTVYCVKKKQCIYVLFLHLFVMKLKSPVSILFM